MDLAQIKSLETASFGTINSKEGLNEVQKRTMACAMKNFVKENAGFFDSCEKIVQEKSSYMFQESPTNTTAGVQTFNQKLTRVITDAIPAMVGFEFCGTHPLPGRTGLIPYTRMRYDNQSGADIFRRSDSFDTDKFGDQTLQSADGRSSLPVKGQLAPDTAYNETDTTPADNVRDGYVVGRALTTATGQDLGDGTAFDQVGMTLDSISITCRERGIKAHWSIETDMFAQAEYGFSFGDSLVNTAKTALLRTINEEVLSIFELAAKPLVDATFVASGTNTFNAGALPSGTALNFQDKASILHYILQKARGDIAKDTRFGIANILICSPNVAAFLSQSDKFRYNPSRQTNLGNDVTNASLVAGYTPDGLKVIIDPYAKNEYALLAYKGDETQAGMYYCPFNPLWMNRGVDPNTGQNIVLMKSLYGIGSSPYANASYVTGNADATITSRTNRFARSVRLINI